MPEHLCAAEQNPATTCSRLFLSRHAVGFTPLQPSEKEHTVHKSFPVLLAPLAALLLAGTALAQGVDARVDRHCTSTTLSADASAPCSSDVLNDGSGNAGAGTTTQPSPGSTGTALTGSRGIVGAGSTATSMGTTGMPSTGTVNSGTSSIPGAMGTGAVSAGGSAVTPARR